MLAPLSKSIVVALGVQLSSVIVKGFVLHVMPNMATLQIFSNFLLEVAVESSVILNVTFLAVKGDAHSTVVTACL